MVVGPFSPAMRTGPSAERVFSASASDEAASLEAAEDAASEEAASDEAAVLDAGPPQAARPSSMAADSSREASFFMVRIPFFVNFFEIVQNHLLCSHHSTIMGGKLPLRRQQRPRVSL